MRWLFALIAFLAVGSASEDCDNVLSSKKEGFSGECKNTWAKLKPLLAPTQSGVGYAWVKYKVDKDFGSAKDAQSSVDASPTPAVIGPDGTIYIVDDHHTLCALDYSGFEDTSVTINVLCDKRNSGETMADFFHDLKSQGLAYLGAHPHNNPNALPVPIPYTSLPTKFSFTKDGSSFANDPWRALAGYSRKVQDVPNYPSCGSSDDKYCERCFYRGCDAAGQSSKGKSVPFFEFQWSYYMNDATLVTPSLWPSKDDFESFSAAYKNLPTSSDAKDVKNVDVDEWLGAAALLVPLCRAPSVAQYRVPTSIYSGSGILPGFVVGATKLDADPDCSPPTCK